MPNQFLELLNGVSGIARWAAKVVVATGILLVVGCASTGSAPQTEAQVIEQLKSPNEAVVTKALMTLEKKYPTSTAGIADI